MASKYNPHKIESKWRAMWPKERESYKLPEGAEKYYVLDMVSYPSSEGLHMGHWLPYTIADVWARYQVLQGKHVLSPVGFDAFGLPAENAAIKTQTHPAAYTQKSIANFSRQIQEMGKMYDWSTCINTSEPSYYKWTQWIFLQLYKNGLAYRKTGLVNWCPSCQTVLANEQVEAGRCERCKTEVTKKELKQWYLKITDFAEELLNFDGLDWPEKVKTLQKNWIGKSEGAEIQFPITGTNKQITVFTTRPDTLMGATYLVLAPEHELVMQITTESQHEAVADYIAATQLEPEIDRIATDRPKTGVFTGAYATHPLTGKDIPIWIADYVLASYGTGAIMAVPAHDERDFVFARQFELPIIQVVATDEIGVDEAAYSGPGVLVNSGTYDGLGHVDAGKQIIADLAEKGLGKRAVQYRLRDWLVSRQRYWGAPIPIIYCEKCGTQPVPESELPVRLPEDAEFMPTGGSPLERHPSFRHATCPSCGGAAERETDTLDTFVDSSWYYLRFTDPRNASAPFSKEQVEKWMPVDFYVGGTEHSILHLLYARFIMRALHRLGYVPYAEPFTKFLGNGMVYLHGSKMSKSKGNVVNPDEMVQQYGTDTMRGYMLFMGPVDQDVEWQPNGITGIHRFLYRAWDVFQRADTTHSDNSVRESIQEMYQTVSELLPKFQFNRCISAFMVAVNKIEDKRLSRREAEVFAVLLAPFFPHFAEEIWREVLGHTTSVFSERWPQVEVSLLTREVTYAIQVNGKLRATLTQGSDAEQSTVVAAAKSLPAVEEFLQGKEVVKTVFVPGRIVNFVVK